MPLRSRSTWCRLARAFVLECTATTSLVLLATVVARALSQQTSEKALLTLTTSWKRYVQVLLLFPFIIAIFSTLFFFLSIFTRSMDISMIFLDKIILDLEIVMKCFLATSFSSWLRCLLTCPKPHISPNIESTDYSPIHSTLLFSYKFPVYSTPNHLLLDRFSNIGPLRSRWELDNFKNCWIKSFRTSKSWHFCISDFRTC